MTNSIFNYWATTTEIGSSTDPPDLCGKTLFAHGNHNNECNTLCPDTFHANLEKPFGGVLYTPMVVFGFELH